MIWIIISVIYLIIGSVIYITMLPKVKSELEVKYLKATIIISSGVIVAFAWLPMIIYLKIKKLMR